HCLLNFFLNTTLVIVLGSVLARAESFDDPVPLLERTITISFEQESVEVALKKISIQAGFTFSYNSKIIDRNKIISERFVGKTVREVLDQIFAGAIQYKARGKYVILTKAAIDEAKDHRVLTGYVVDESTGKRLQNVSVYDPVSLSSTVTDPYGYFQLKVDEPSGEEIKLAIRKLNYTDTLIAVDLDRRQLINIQMREHADKMNAFADSVRQKIKRFWQTKVRSPQATNMENIQDTLYRKFQFSVFPFVGTNHKLSGNVINDYSLNLYGGYSLGLRELEFGGLFNVVRGDVTGAQIAGVFNAVGGKMKFLQFAGIYNMNRDSVDGYQFAGMVNLNGNSTSKFSGAGLLNFTLRDSRATQVAGLGNATIGKQEGAHVAGLFNFSSKESRIAQVAGLTNVTIGDFKGAQVSGLLNFTLKALEGAQVSGLLNYATRVRGAQVGIINATDSIHGVPIGLISFVLKGYHKIEVSTDEIFYTNVAFRTGVRQFYNILTVGAKPNTFDDEETYWTFGYGIGTAPRLSKTLSLNVDLTANQVVYGQSIEAINMINKLYLGLDFQIIKNLGVTFGVTLNGYITDTTYDKYQPLFTDYKPNIISDKMYSNDINMKMWWGGKIGLRFL
ncbi:MAG TPA: STN and carboxypeptidase regulatory-like domain-containing protein, partial [Chryseolinea sp.]|nr:STN and carboxypeptidase regulatory-like domain-containing protein [Chryseolinea sp.]